MDTQASLSGDRLTFACPSCNHAYAWASQEAATRGAEFALACGNCGAAFNVKNPASPLPTTPPPVVPSSRGENDKPSARKVSVGMFAVAIAAFLLPFLSMTCQGQRFYTFSGRELVTGTTIETKGAFGQSDRQKIGPQPLAIVALFAAVAGLVVAARAKREEQAAGILAVVGAAVLFWLKSKIESDTASQTAGMVQVDFQFGYWLALLAFAGGTVVNFGLLKRFLWSAPSESLVHPPLDSAVTLPEALAGLESPDPATRERSASQLGEMGVVAHGALPRLELLKSDPVSRVRGRAAWAVEEIRRKLRLADPARS